MTQDLIIQNSGEIIQKLVLDGDLSKMSEAQKVNYYTQFCESLGLNPLTQPFQIIAFQGKQRLYATKDCTEQLRKIHCVSITDIMATEIRGIFVVTAKAQDKNGKTDAATGAVSLTKSEFTWDSVQRKNIPTGKVIDLSGDELANAFMKAETKAKRRVTLSICGMGMLDESELETMPGAKTIDIEPELAAIEKQVRTMYDKVEDIEIVLDSCDNIGQIRNLYQLNSNLIEATPELKKKFTSRKKQINEPATT